MNLKSAWISRLVSDNLIIFVELLPFEAFVDLMANFKSVNTHEKIDRLFKVIDEDGNGSLSYDEIVTLVSRSLSTYTKIW